MTDARQKAIEACLRQAFAPLTLRVKDQSHLHAGHEGARDGKGHFDVLVVSAAFDGLSRLARHRQVYAALSGLLQSDIHALRIQALSPEEFTNTSAE